MEPEKGWFQCPKCLRKHYFDGTWDALCQYDAANVFSSSVMNRDEKSRHIPRCTCGKGYYDEIWRMVKVND